MFDDAELIVGGPGDGSTVMSEFSASMFLEYDESGIGFQFAPNTWNFAPNTAETISSVQTLQLENPVGVDLGYPTESALGTLYNSDRLGFQSNSVSGCSGWIVTLDGANLVKAEYVSASGFAASTVVPDGTYSWYVTGASGCTASPNSGQTTVVSGGTIVQFTLSGGGGGGGCVAWGTPILTPQGYTPVQRLQPGDQIEEYDFQTGALMVGAFVSGNTTRVTQLIDVNNGWLYVTPTEQPIYIRNATFEGWLHDPQNLTTADSIFDPVSDSWIAVSSIQLVEDHTKVFDVVTTGVNNFIAAGALLDKKF